MAYVISHLLRKKIITGKLNNKKAMFLYNLITSVQIR